MNDATLDKMRKMKLLGMYRAFKTNLETETQEHYTPDEIIAHLIDAEWDERQHRTVEQKIKNCLTETAQNLCIPHKHTVKIVQDFLTLHLL